MVLSAGLASLTAVAASFLMRLVTGDRQAWVTPVQIFALEMAGAFLIAALGMAIFMPRAVEAARPDPGARATPLIVLLLLGLLAAAALAQVPSLSAWWAEDRGLLAGLTPGTSGPSGLDLIPAIVLFSLPAIAALALATFVLTSIVGLIGRGDLAFGALTGCVCLQAGLVVGEQFLLNAMAGLGATVLDAIARSPDATASAQVTEWLARHDAAASGVCRRLIWILGGYTVTAAIAGLFTRRRLESR